MKRVLNFYPGPAALPLEALESAKEELLDWRGTGMSVLEISHRSKEFEELVNETKDLLREMLGIPKNYQILFLQGGATLQFAMVPMNLLAEDETASYIVTGSFAKKSYAAAKLLRSIQLAASTEEDGKFFRIPRENEIKIEPKSIYCHLTSNNTIFGTQWKSFPNTGSVPIVADMSSDILSRKIDFSPFGLIYAGAQKNLGPSGVTLVIVRDDLVERSQKGLPEILSYQVLASKNSLYNTPPCFALYMVNKVVKWVKKRGGLGFIEKQNEEKARMVYDLIDKNPGFFKSSVERESRSSMNVTFRLPTEELESKFVSEAKQQDIIGVKGHRSVGGIRLSMYNANEIEAVKTLVGFMKDFLDKNG